MRTRTYSAVHKRTICMIFCYISSNGLEAEMEKENEIRLPNEWPWPWSGECEVGCWDGNFIRKNVIHCCHPDDYFSVWLFHNCILSVSRRMWIHWTTPQSCSKNNFEGGSFASHLQQQKCLKYEKTADMFPVNPTWTESLKSTRLILHTQTDVGVDW